jgi:hypothetical protein
MPQLKGQGKAPPKRPFAANMFGSIMRLGVMLDTLEVHEVQFQFPRSWGESSTIEHYYVKIRTSQGTVTRKHKNFVGAFVSAIASVELWEEFDGKKEETS